MSCPICDDRLIELLYGTLGATERATLEEHLASTPECAREAHALGATLQATRRQRQDDPSAALIAGLRAEARKQVAEMRAASGAMRPAVRRAPPPAPAPTRDRFGILAAVRELLARSIAIPVWVPAAALLVVVAVLATNRLRPRPDTIASLPLPPGDERGEKKRDTAAPPAVAAPRHVPVGGATDARNEKADATPPALAASTQLPAPADPRPVAAQETIGAIAANRPPADAFRQAAKDQGDAGAKELRDAGTESSSARAGNELSGVSGDVAMGAGAAAAGVPGPEPLGKAAEMDRDRHRDTLPPPVALTEAQAMTARRIAAAPAAVAPTEEQPEARSERGQAPTAAAILADLAAGNAAAAIARDGGRAPASSSAVAGHAREPESARDGAAAGVDRQSLLAGCAQLAVRGDRQARLAVLAFYLHLGSDADPTVARRALVEAVRLGIRTGEIERARQALAALASRSAPEAATLAEELRRFTTGR